MCDLLSCRILQILLRPWLSHRHLDPIALSTEFPRCTKIFRYVLEISFKNFVPMFSVLKNYALISSWISAFFFQPTNEPLDVTLHIQHHILHGNAEIPYLCVSIQNLVKWDVFVPAETGAIKHRRFPGKVLDQWHHQFQYIIH